MWPQVDPMWTMVDLGLTWPHPDILWCLTLCDLIYKFRTSCSLQRSFFTSCIVSVFKLNMLLSNIYDYCACLHNIVIMGSGRDLSPRKMGQLQVYLENSTVSCHEIADKLGISVRSVFNIKMKLKNGDSLSSHRVGMCGRKPVSSARQDRMLVAMCKNDDQHHLRIWQINWRPVVGSAVPVL